jgi:hypothetical protein
MFTIPPTLITPGVPPVPPLEWPTSALFLSGRGLTTSAWVGLELPDSFSWCTWIRPTAWSTNYVWAVLSAASGSYNYRVVMDTPAYWISLQWSVTGTTWVIAGQFNGGSVLPSDVWYHVAVVRNEAEGKVRGYFNGVEMLPAASQTGEHRVPVAGE